MLIEVLIIVVVVVIYFYKFNQEKTEISSFEINGESSDTKQNSNQTNLSTQENTETENEVNTIKVHISGAVKNEGLIELNENSRIQDAIDMAEGLTESADISNINLAYILEDGMKIYIPEVGEDAQEEINVTTSNSTSKQNTTSIETSTQNKDETEKYITKSNSENKDVSNKININKATQTELESLPGIGPSTAIKIIQYRTEEEFKTIEDIKNVSGIGDSKYDKIKDLITTK